MNRGMFKGNQYTKYVDFSKAVLWKDRELSLPRFIIIGFKAHQTDRAVFIDTKKGEKWTFKVSDIMDNGEFKKVGQEEQKYFSIDLAVKEKIGSHE